MVGVNHQLRKVFKLVSKVFQLVFCSYLLVYEQTRPPFHVSEPTNVLFCSFKDITFLVLENSLVLDFDELDFAKKFAIQKLRVRRARAGGPARGNKTAAFAQRARAITPR